jgi:hypothetical protein
MPKPVGSLILSTLQLHWAVPPVARIVVPSKIAAEHLEEALVVRSICATARVVHPERSRRRHTHAQEWPARATSTARRACECRPGTRTVRAELAQEVSVRLELRIEGRRCVEARRLLLAHVSPRLLAPVSSSNAASVSSAARCAGRGVRRTHAEHALARGGNALEYRLPRREASVVRVCPSTPQRRGLRWEAGARLTSGSRSISSRLTTTKCCEGQRGHREQRGGGAQRSSKHAQQRRKWEAGRRAAECASGAPPTQSGGASARGCRRTVPCDRMRRVGRLGRGWPTPGASAAAGARPRKARRLHATSLRRPASG